MNSIDAGEVYTAGTGSPVFQVMESKPTGVTVAFNLPKKADVNAIDKWIESAYAGWPNKPEYLLIVGNKAAVPPRIIDPSGIPFASNTYFGVIGTGGTIPVPSINIGRITGDKNAAAGDPAVLKFVAWKIIQFESTPAYFL